MLLRKSFGRALSFCRGKTKIGAGGRGKYIRYGTDLVLSPPRSYTRYGTKLVSVSLGVSVLMYETPETPQTPQTPETVEYSHDLVCYSHEFLSRFSSLFPRTQDTNKFVIRTNSSHDLVRYSRNGSDTPHTISSISRNVNDIRHSSPNAFEYAGT